METVKVSVKGAGSLEVEAISAKEVYDLIDMHLAIDKAMEVHKVKRGPKKKSKGEASQ